MVSSFRNAKHQFAEITRTNKIRFCPTDMFFEIDLAQAIPFENGFLGAP